MTHEVNYLEFAGVSAVGVFGLLLALGLLFAGRSRGKVAFSLGLLTLAILVVATAAAFLLNLPPPLVIATSVLTGLWATGLVVRSRTVVQVTQGALWLLGRPKVQGFTLLVLSLGALVGWPLWLEQRDTAGIENDNWGLVGGEKPELLPEPFHAATDRGNPLPLFRTGPDTQPATREREKTHYANMGYQTRLIQTDDARIECNCHGWVFADGRHWVKGNDVPKILSENGYREITDPRADDLVVYRSEQGEVLHTALVRSVLSGGTTLVESKWGQMGRFLHRIEDQSYSKTWAFYRSDRRGHVLSGLSGGSTGDPYSITGRNPNIRTH